MFFQSSKTKWPHTLDSLQLAWDASPSASIAIAVLTVCSAVLPLGIAYTGKLIVDAVITHAVQLTVRLVIFEFTIIAAQTFVLRSLSFSRLLLGDKLALSTNFKILEKAIQLELAQFEHSETNDKLNQAWRESSSRPAQMVNDTLNFFQNALTLAGYISLLVSYNIWAVLMMILASLPVTIAETRFAKTTFRLQNRRSPERRRLSYLEHILATDTHAKEVKVLGLGPVLLKRYKNESTRFHKEDKQLLFKRSSWTFGLSLLSLLAFYGAYLMMAIGAARNVLTLGNLTLYIVAFRQGQQAFQSCLTALGSIYEHNLYMSNLFDFLNLQLTAPKSFAHISSSPILHTEGITFEKVSFKYPGSKEFVLKNISFHLPKGQSVSLVGNNGAGKTTLIKLICRLYAPTQGRILLDGKDLMEWNRETLWKRLSVVFQDFNKYYLTFGENVGVGKIEYLENEKRIIDAAELGGASDILDKLSNGVRTQLGRWFPGGVDLSGGQWQSIAMSRAFMRDDSNILILDEPTAALDPEAEYAVFTRFRKLTRGKTSFIISHRFPTARLADRIIVIEGGSIIEQGDHDTLISNGGKYSKLFAIQAQGYR